MRRHKFSGIIIGILAIVVATLTMASGAAASTFKVLHTFSWANGPEGSLVFDTAGNLYGATVVGGAYGNGVVYRLAPNSNGSWTVSILYSFKGGTDGANPSGGLTFDAVGNLYGTTPYGGGGGICGGCGIVFKLAPHPDGTWTESVLHRFSGADGTYPFAGLTLDAAGNLYGTTVSGGGCSFRGLVTCGVVYKLAPNPDGSWTESVLHSFSGPDGVAPASGVTLDASGNLYGTTDWGGGCVHELGCGVVYKLAPSLDGSWTESVLHSFSGTDGAYPFAGLTLDAAGNLYGTTADGGACSLGGVFGCGVVFRLAPNPDGSWTESVLHSFHGTDGDAPHYGLTFDEAGNLYGTTAYGGSFGYGVVFKLTPTTTCWKETILHTFVGYGKHPYAPLIFDRAGNLYGSVELGGSNNMGFVFRITR